MFTKNLQIHHQDQKKNIAVAIFVLFIGFFLVVPEVDARVVFSTEEGETNADTFVIDADDSTSGDISIDFGTSLSATFRYDTIAGNFELTKDLDLQGNEIIDVVIDNGTAFPGTQKEGQIFYRSDLDTLYINTDGTGGGWSALSTSTNADTLDTLDSLQFLRSDTSDNFTSGTLTFDAGTTLDADAGSVSIDELVNDTLILDSDNSGTDVSLQFGNTLAETIKWDDGNSRFDVSDDLNVAGDITTTGALDVDGTSTLDGDVILGDGASDSITFNGKIGSSVDFDGNEVINFVLDNEATFPASPVLGEKFFHTGNDIEYVYTSAGWAPTSSSTGSGRTMYFAAEYPDTTLFGDGSSNSGTMEADHDATGDRNFYKWSSTKSTLQDYDIVMQVRVPDDFDSWQATPMKFTYKTDTGASTAEAQIDISVEDTAGSAEGSLSGNEDLDSDTWATTSITGFGGTYTPGSYMIISLKMQSRKLSGTVYGAYAGEIEFFYNTK